MSTEQLATGKPREARDKPLSGEERGWGSDEAGTQNNNLGFQQKLRTESRKG